MASIDRGTAPVVWPIWITWTVDRGVWEVGRCCVRPLGSRFLVEAKHFRLTSLKTKYVNCRDARQFFQTLADPGFAVIEVPAAVRIDAAKKGAADAARHAVIDPDDRFIDDPPAIIDGHGSFVGKAT